MAQTLDQKRAALAWGYAKAGTANHPKSYKNLAKGASALILNSGLMPTLAFYNGKDKNDKDKAAQCLLDDLICGLSQRINGQAMKPGQGQQVFSHFMEKLQKVESHEYLRYTNEALELLTWIRQFVDAVEPPATEAKP
ncbi:type III-B CRISPR module-associated protein Cmr5 [Roseateles sp. GG27B]